jgi:23S rRNA pseudouridine955/2504/2580 synthase
VTAVRKPAVAARRLRIDAGSAGQRLDNFLLRELSGLPRSRVYRLLRKGEVRVNGGRKQADYRLAIDDEVRLPPLREAPRLEGIPRSVPERLLATVRAAIVQQDERVLVLDKPAGLAVHGGSGLSFGAIEALRALRPDEPLELVHRLDRETSGCLLVARTRAALMDAHALLRAGEVEKHYTALVTGRWRLGRKTVDAPLLTNARQGGERVVRVHRTGKLAMSTFDPLAHFRDIATLMDVSIGTGRTHQIRVHAAFAGHPVAGDEKYGDRDGNAGLRALGLGRMFLHASSVSFRWPGDRAGFRAEAPLPAELEAVLARLRERPAQP